MTTYLLKSLTMKNFMGCTGSFEFDPGRNIFAGKNGAGKTRIANGIYFGLYGKSFAGKMPGDFEIKTIVEGEIVHDVDYAVAQTWMIDGEELTLERIYREKWTKKRGRTDSELTGHEVDYRINGDAKTTKRDFEERVEKTFGNAFRLCSDLFALQKMPWISKQAEVMQRRREILTDCFGDCDKEKIIDGIDGFRKVLDKRTPEQARKNTDEKKAEINKELKEIPISIAE